MVRITWILNKKKVCASLFMYIMFRYVKTQTIHPVAAQAGNVKAQSTEIQTWKL